MTRFKLNTICYETTFSGVHHDQLNYPMDNHDNYSFRVKVNYDFNFIVKIIIIHCDFDMKKIIYIYI